MKRTLILALAVLMLVVAPGMLLRAEAAEIVDSGTCGENLTWVLDSEGTLTISGPGAMEDYTMPWMDYREEIRSVVIEEGITYVGAYAFYECPNLTQVTIPLSVTAMGDQAFSDSPVETSCYAGAPSQWKLITQNNSGPWDSIVHCAKPGKDLTWSYDSGKSLLVVSGTGPMDDFMTPTMPVPWEGIMSQIKLVTIEEGVASVGAIAFHDCGALTEVTIPKSVNDIAQGAFGGQNSLQSITVDAGNADYASENGVLFNKSKTALLQYPRLKNETDYSIPDGVTEIATAAFEKCSKLYSVHFPNSLQTIGHFAFLECDGLQQIRIPDNVTELGYSAFQSCTNLKRVEIGKGITYLGICVFEGCASLEEVILPDTLVNIGENVFAYCTSLKRLQLPAGMNFISDGAFHDCTALEEIVIGGVKEIYWPTEGCTVLKKVTFLGDAPNYCTLAFNTMTLTAYYPAGNATWTDTVRESFGGNVTWKAYCAAHSFGDWVTEGNTTRRTCTLCGHTEQKIDTGSGNVEIEIPGQPELDTEVDVVLPSDSSYVLVEEALDSAGNQDQTILKVFDINLKNADGVHVQPSGTVKVKLPLDWEKDGYYKVYRVNEDGTLTDMNAYRQGSHVVFETDHFSLYALVQVDMDNPFQDVPFGQWYTDSVLWAVDKGITNGLDETHFGPEATCTRGQIVTFLWRANGSPKVGGMNPFTDVPADAWYADAVLWAVAEGITTGTSATTFSPDAGCTRGQVATFLWRAEDKPISGGNNIFTDITPGTYYYDAVLWAVANGVTNGVGEGLFAPDATCTRGQIVTFLYRAMV